MTKYLSICTDDAPVMLGCRSGFMKHIKEPARMLRKITV